MRYIGNKISILKEIAKLLHTKGLVKQNLVFCDAFSGTASVCDHFKHTFKIIANDVQYYSYVITQAKLNVPDLKFSKLSFNPFVYFNQNGLEYKGFIYNNYSLGGSERMYFSEQNALKIDFIRHTIEDWNNENKITKEEYFYLIASLLESVSKVANVAGVYGSYLKFYDPRAEKNMKFIKVEETPILKDLFEQEEKKSQNADVYNKKIEDLIFEIEGDILYLDPPYTNNQYSVQYHLLETIAKYDNPEIKGKGGLRNTTITSSDFSKKGNVEVVFEKIIANAKFKYIVFSYSSDGLMSQKYIEKVLKRYGKVDTLECMEIPYKQYKNHQTTDNEKHCEFLYFIEKKESEKVFYASPLNYQGGKCNMIEFIKDNLPKTMPDKFFDIFGGGYNVGVNIEAKEVFYNDINHIVVDLIKLFAITDTADFIKYILRNQKKYKLEKANKETYTALRDIFNAIPLNERDYKMLYLLILYGFNQQIRFNSSYDYNNPVGEAGFNDCILEKIVSFSRQIKAQNVIFSSKYFTELEYLIDNDSFVYCDPPYLITLGSYNDGKRGFNGWNETDEKNLYVFLKRLDTKGIRFMLSNVLEHKEEKNYLLEKWILDNNFNTKFYNYKNGKRQEIIVTNY
ncbi:MAG: Dam family site-specific DNA-(adenine-N6)-methyltransferase [Prevotellaceae bacterium]|jgi:adenine-specific DNA-methyltransferase|nr:Dam family site-specific DNA-(adenine-N6)-methyltransferase [Prevotellaceae bacterium]